MIFQLTWIITYKKKGAIIGPFHINPPSHGIVVSPFNSVPKKDTNKRQVILDLSGKGGSGINDFISKDEYLRISLTLVLMIPFS